MKKLQIKRSFKVIGITLAVFVLILATVLGVIYYNKPVYKNATLQIYRSDKYVLSNKRGTPEDKGWTKTKFSNSEREIVYDFLKQLKVEEVYQEPQQNVGLPPEFTIYSRYYEAYFKIWSSHGVEGSIYYNDKAAGGESSHYYLFTVPEENFKRIISLLDSD